MTGNFMQLHGDPRGCKGVAVNTYHMRDVISNMVRKCKKCAYRCDRMIKACCIAIFNKQTMKEKCINKYT